MFLVGLTGNFGMGKSSVLEMFAELGAPVISSDAIVAGLLREPVVVQKIGRLFGREVIGADGRIDKKAVAERVFKDPAQRKLLEEYLHPLVFAGIEIAAGRVRSGGPVIVEVPLLFESGASGRFDITITVHTSYEQAVERLMKKGISREDAAARLNSQMPIEDKIRSSDYSIDNSGSAEVTRKQVMTMYEVLRGVMIKAGAD